MYNDLIFTHTFERDLLLYKKDLEWIVEINKIFIDEIPNIELFKTMVRRFFSKYIDGQKKSYTTAYKSTTPLSHKNVDVICLITDNDVTTIIHEINDYYNLKCNDYCNSELDLYRNKYRFLIDFIIKNSRLMADDVYDKIYININKEIFPMTVFNMYNYDSLPEEIKVAIYGK